MLIKRTLAAFGVKQFVGDRVIDNASCQLAIALEGDRNGEMRDAVHEVGGAVERVNDPRMRFIRAFNHATFFENEAVAGASFLQFFEDNFLRAQIGIGNKVTRAFARDLQIFNFTKVATQSPASFFGGGNHYIQNRGVCHVLFSSL
jgi:hypothetical protein